MRPQKVFLPLLTLCATVGINRADGADDATTKSIFADVQSGTTISAEMFTQSTPYQKYPSVATAPFSLLDSYAYKQQNIERTIRLVADYQIKKYGDNIPTKDWLVGTFYSGFIAAYQVTGDEWYLDQAYNWSVSSQWDIRKPLNADDVCPGQTYLDLYFVKRDPSFFATLDKKLSPYFDRDEIQPGEKDDYTKTSVPLTGRNVWSWCDALYMAPTVYARMGKATGDKRYFEMLHRLYWDAVDFLYAPDEQLFHRNSKAATEKDRTPGGRKVYWGRGNGWVIGGLARLIEFLPDEDPMKERYLSLFRELAYSIARYQMEDGLWRSCINEPEWYPLKETSGSAFYVYAFAKGINEGWLPRDYFAPAVLKGWSGLMSCVTPEGKLGYSQIVAGSPHEVRPSDNKDYATGAFLLAASEMIKLNASEELKALERREFKPQLVAKDGAWTWYNDERVVYKDNVFFASYVKRNGHSALTTFATEKWSSCYSQKEHILSSWTQSDDHNCAALLPLKDGRLLASYATHSKSQCFFQNKITLPRWDPAVLGQEQTNLVADTKWGVTYQNLHRLAAESDRIYNFFRGENYNPNFIYSDDEAETWSKPILLIEAGSHSNQRPYVKYVSNGVDRIDFLYTDGHPRDVKDNSVYHFYYQKGAFYNSTGKRIRTMKQIVDNPIRPEEGTLIYDGSEPTGRGWCHDIEYDADGEPYAAFVTSPSGDVGSDMRYWVATFDGKRWASREIAYAGSNLYKAEQHYAGGMALAPKQHEIVISTNVDPKSGERLPNNKYQLFKGVESGDSWEFTQLTFDPVFDNLRPVIVRGDNNALFWMTGIYGSYMNFHTDIMMSYGY